MTYEIKREETNIAELTITIENEKVKNAYRQAFSKISKDISIPGFRKGKAPKNILEQRIGKEALADEAAEILMPPAYAEAVTNEELEPVERPQIKIVTNEEDSDFVFVAKVTLRPEVILGEYKGLELSRITIVVTEDNIESELKQMQERRAKFETTQQPIEEDDTVQVSYTGYIDGEEFEGGSAENYSLTIGSGTFIPGFEEQLIGHQAGDQVEVNVTFPDEYHNDALQGKEAKFEVTVKEVRRKSYLPLDDQFAQDVSEFQTMAELRESVKQRLEEEAERDSNDRLRDMAIQRLLEITEIDVPVVMVEERIDNFVEDMNARLQQQGLDIDKYLEYTGKDMKAMREEYRETALRAIKTELALLEVAKREDIEVEEADIEKEIAGAALATNSEPTVIRERLMETGQYESLVFSILINKAIDFLVDKGNYVTADDLLDDEEDGNEAEQETATAGAASEQEENAV